MADLVVLMDGVGATMGGGCCDLDLWEGWDHWGAQRSVSTDGTSAGPKGQLLE